MPRRNSSGHPAPGRNRSARAKMQRGADRQIRADNLPEQRDRRPRTVGAVVCPTGKTGFSEAVAQERLERFRSDDSNRRRVPTRIYRCDHCRAWHLTSSPARES